ncbi:MAG: aminodeoxychorismate/anthranilate synthase component II [Deltaproteobacteria bacterium]|nr:aminodeoxychorismate/anthranilate synthase component II [Deltaproteobacteria bacterium]MBW2069189.1 aminodeoxychorismate/anthranilate synthase component II [Deltaproteobacteria bacterium]
MKRLIMIDNYDSFTFNLVQLFSALGVEVLVFRHDEIDTKAIEKLSPNCVCISPGPKDPQHAGISKDVVIHFGGRIPILGVCLGMQVINEVFGGKTAHAPVPVHGKTSLVRHTGQGIFKGIPSPFRAARYHSLCINRYSDCLTETAWSEDGVIMAIEHKTLPIFGVQFHPESFLTEHGTRLACNFLETVK